jgi:hypothetical protein
MELYVVNGFKDAENGLVVMEGVLNRRLALDLFPDKGLEKYDDVANGQIEDKFVVYSYIGGSRQVIPYSAWLRLSKRVTVG